MKFIKKINYLLFIITSCISIYFGIKYVIDTNLTKFLMSASIIPIMLLPYFLNKKLTHKLNDDLILVYFLFVISSIVLGSICDFYKMIPYFDKVLHFTTGVLSSLVALNILKNFNVKDKYGISFNLIFMASITCMLSIFWEIFEYISDFIFSGNAQRVLETGINDTMLDMIIAIIGFIVFSTIYVIRKSD